MYYIMKRFCALFLGLLFTTAASAGPRLNVTNLTTEYSREPIGIDNPIPRFSWEVGSSSRDYEQKAYRIVVERIGPAGGEQPHILWDSGKVSSGQSVAVEYGGGDLQSRTAYGWKVRIWNRDGNCSPWSAKSFFNTAIMNRDRPEGKWIWEDTQVTPNDYAFFRKTVQLHRVPKRVYCLVTAHNHFVLYINGKQISGVGNPAPSNPYKNKYYVTYEIGGQLIKGSNAICAMVHYMGKSGQGYVDGVPGFLCEIWTQGPDGPTVLSATDKSWKVLADTPFDEASPFYGKRNHIVCEYLTAGKMPGDWLSAKFDDSAWKNAKEVGTEFKLRSQLFPEVKQVDLIEPVRIKPPEGIYIFDFGKEFSGFSRVTLRGKAGSPVIARYSDRLANGRAARSLADEPEETNVDMYVPSSNAPETWQQWFGIRGFRYVELSGAWNSNLIVDKVQGVYSRTSLPRRAAFECSDPLFNSIFEASVLTQAMAMQGQLVDCVHREQSQWLGDADMQSGTVFYNFLDPHIVRKTLRDFADGQYDDGHLPAKYPSQGRFQRHVPEWSLHYPEMLWRSYFYYNDAQILRECRPVVTRLLNWFRRRQDKTGLLVKSTNWHISDWPEDFAKMDQTGKYLIVENCLYYNALLVAGRISEVLGDSRASTRYAERAVQLRASINRVFYDPKSGKYRDCYPGSTTSTGAGVLPLYFRIVPASDTQKVLAYVTGKGLSTSTHLTYYFMQMLWNYEQDALAKRIIANPSWPGWGYMVKSGDGTVWEGWSNRQSRAHAWNAHLARLFLSEVLGIRPLKAGWQRIRIRPHSDGHLTWAKGFLMTPRGKVSVEWKKEPETFSLRVSIPGNTTARVYIPDRSGADDNIVVYENGSIVRTVLSSDLKRTESDIGGKHLYIPINVGSGNWEFILSSSATVQ